MCLYPNFAVSNPYRYMTRPACIVSLREKSHLVYVQWIIRVHSVYALLVRVHSVYSQWARAHSVCAQSWRVHSVYAHAMSHKRDRLGFDWPRETDRTTIQ